MNFLKIKEVFSNPFILITGLAGRGFLNWLPDKQYLKIQYFAIFKKNLDLDKPKTFNEKLNWLKLYDRKPEYTQMVDKYLVRHYIKEKIGEEYLIPLIGVWDSPDDIDFDSLPERFVLKCNHNSGLGMYICKDKSKMDVEKVKKDLRRGLAQDYYLTGREWPYKNVKPRIIAEQYMVDESGVELKDYKIFCFNGEPDYIEVDFNRFIEHKLNTYNFNWEPLNFCDKSKSDYSANINRPEALEKMREIARILSADMRFLRVDFYYINGAVYVGELTLYPGSGFIQYDPPEMDLIYGKKLDLSK